MSEKSKKETKEKTPSWDFRKAEIDLKLAQMAQNERLELKKLDWEVMKHKKDKESEKELYDLVRWAIEGPAVRKRITIENQQDGMKRMFELGKELGLSEDSKASKALLDLKLAEMTDKEAKEASEKKTSETPKKCKPLPAMIDQVLRLLAKVEFGVKIYESETTCPNGHTNRQRNYFKIDDKYCTQCGAKLLTLTTKEVWESCKFVTVPILPEELIHRLPLEVVDITCPNCSKVFAIVLGTSQVVCPYCKSILGQTD